VSELTVESPKTLRNFCSGFCEKHSAEWPPDEHKIAYEFVTYFDPPPLARIDDYKTLAARLAIEVSIAPLPEGLRGYNSRYQEKKQIILEKLQGPAQNIGIAEHTFLHEFRELIEYEFRREGRPTVVGQDLEARAELFAKVVRTLTPIAFMSDCAGDLIEAESSWRFLGLGLLIGFGLLHTFTCFLLPHHEEYFRKLK
jgi:hypothetical protein